MSGSIQEAIRQLRRSVAARAGVEDALDDFIDETPASFYGTLRRRLAVGRPPAEGRSEEPASGAASGAAGGLVEDPATPTAGRRADGQAKASTTTKVDRSRRAPVREARKTRVVRMVLITATVIGVLAVAGFLLFHWLIEVV